MSHIFISYSSKNRDYANRLAEKLREEGFQVWIDNKRIESGEDWWKSIMTALRSSVAFIVLMTPESENSDWVQREVTIADSLRIPDFPLLLEGSGNLLESDHWSIYVRTQYIDVRGEKLPDAAFCQRLRQALDVSAKDSEPQNITGVGVDFRGIMLNREGLPDIHWIRIPKGEFIYGSERQKNTLPDYYISRYPVTYKQFGAFIDADGYERREFWTDSGWQWKQDNDIKTLLYWDNADWHIDVHPVVFVTCFEAMAFCRWLSQAVGYTVKLPSEARWEKAARGTDGRIFPWGNTYQKGVANINDTYFKGYRVDPATLRLAKPVLEASHRSPYGVQDISGNVWEWCLPDTVTEDDVQPDTSLPMRGGSWYFNYEYATTTYKFMIPADSRRYEGGFRIVCDLPEKQ